MFSTVKQVLLRHFSLTAAINKSHYDSLGVTSKATHTEIKNAYYKLSMVYHPDKNKGSDEAANMFRDITAAYEVLGNRKLRTLYDKGLLHTAGSEFSSYNTETVPENVFYKSREQRSKPPVPTGRSNVYNFDEWTRAHYETTFQRTKRDRSQGKAREDNEFIIKSSFQSEILVLGILGMALIFFSLFARTDNLDTPTIPKKKINIATADQ